MLMADQTTKEIKDICKGEKVMSWSPRTKQMSSNTITEVLTGKSCDLAQLTLRAQESGKSTVITCTAEHPLYLKSGSWASVSPNLSQFIHGMTEVNSFHTNLQNVIKLKDGDVIQGVFDCFIVEGIEKQQGSIQQIYTLRLEDYPNTFVANGVIAHNKCNIS